ncbi:hypothetical protein [Ktedonobacter racemifer]|uniref:AT hook, DNA-binding motif protein n=1 Tax=Ktedonobacter racemifer DSM 44963 TaxID=485913 RepID=D6U8T9_KTERA|nr:hypothetical protein [Ktedonobacter racemifer]EFH79649.1 AT hook, DNA-binding motif protein [Ktedonobacter racemifer DSM 44963]
MNEPPIDDQGQEPPPQEEQPTTRKRGRPRKWTREQRRIEPVGEGRMSFKPGDPHPMDAQIEEAGQLREAITQQLEQLQGLVHDLAQLDDPGAAISREEQAISKLLWRMYGTRKHREHILATFIAARRRRLLQRLQAAEAALEQARAFLTADAGLLPLLQQTIAQAQAHALALHGPPPPVPGEAPGTQEGEATEKEAQEQAAPPEEQPDPQAEQRHALMQSASGGDDATTTRAALAAYEERARIMRNAIGDARGSFEWYYIPKPKVRTREAAELLARGEALPEGMQEFEEEEEPGVWGPYLRYRWWEGKERYSIGLGHVRGDDSKFSTEPPIF